MALRTFGRRRGSVLVEFTLALPVLTLLFIGTWQFGYAFFLYNELEQAVRSGARYASLLTYDSADSTPTANFRDDVRNVVLYGDPAGGTKTVVPGLTAENVIVECSFFANGFATPPGVDMKTPVRVAVSIDNFSVGTLGTIKLTRKPRTEFPYVGTYDHP